MIQRLRIVKCQRCGVKYTRYFEEHKHRGFPVIQGVSARCVERSWEVCPNCLKLVIEFMENKK